MHIICDVCVLKYCNDYLLNKKKLASLFDFDLLSIK